MTIGLLTYGTQIESSKKENGYDSSLEKSEWYALHVRRRFEHVVPFHLKKQNIEHYLLPLRRVTRQSSIRSIELPYCRVMSFAAFKLAKAVRYGRSLGS